MALGRRGRDRGFDYWPGFVDALSTFLLAIIFLLSVFMLAQFFLTGEIANKDKEIATKDDVMERLNKQLSQLSNLLSAERTAKGESDQALVQLRASLNALLDDKAKIQLAHDALMADKARLQSEIDTSKTQIGGLGEQNKNLGSQVEAEKRAAQQALAQIEILNAQISELRKQLSTIESALGLMEKKDQDQKAQIADLGSRLNVALAEQVKELGRYRSEFFGRLRDVMSGRSDVQIVGDRFVFPSEVLFAPGAAVLQPSGLAELEKVANAMLDVGKQIPDDIQWIMRVDGHTDRKPIASQQFPSNWELSSARAIAVVRHLIAKGIPANRLAATGFGEFQPIDSGDTPEALAKNRRIELKLTDK